MKQIKSKKAYISLSIKIIISVVIGGLLTVGIYALIQNQIVPKMVEKSERVLVEDSAAISAIYELG